MKPTDFQTLFFFLSKARNLEQIQRIIDQQGILELNKDQTPHLTDEETEACKDLVEI